MSSFVALANAYDSSRVVLVKDDLPATVRSSQERMMTMLQRDLKDRARQHREEKIQKKYRMVKFFGELSFDEVQSSEIM